MKCVLSWIIGFCCALGLMGGLLLPPHVDGNPNCMWFMFIISCLVSLGFVFWQALDDE
jgi:hypothetical protein